jgi:hypothetical protein
MFFQRLAAFANVVKPGMNVPVGTISEEFLHLRLAGERGGRNQFAIRILQAGGGAGLGGPQQVEGGAHMHLFLDHGGDPLARPLAVQIGRLPACHGLGPEFLFHHRGVIAEAHVERADVVVGRDPHMFEAVDTGVDRVHGRAIAQMPGDRHPLVDEPDHLADDVGGHGEIALDAVDTGGEQAADLVRHRRHRLHAVEHDGETGIFEAGAGAVEQRAADKQARPELFPGIEIGAVLQHQIEPPTHIARGGDTGGEKQREALGVHHHGVNVGVDQARQHGLAGEIHHFCPGRRDGPFRHLADALALDQDRHAGARAGAQPVDQTRIGKHGGLRHDFLPPGPAGL